MFIQRKNIKKQAPLARLKNSLLDFCQDTKGNISIYAAVILTTLIAFSGSSAVDLIRHSNVQSQIQSAVEAGVLAAAALDNNISTEDTLDDYIRANIDDPEIAAAIAINTLTDDVSLNDRTIKVEARYDVPTTFMRLFNINSLLASASAEANQRLTTVEIAMVLDVSSSMDAGSPVTRLESLQVAATEFIDNVSNNGADTNVSISLVPYGGSVNLGQTIFDRYAAEIEPDNSNLDPGQSAYFIGPTLQDRNFRFSDVGSHCIEATRDDFEGDLLPENSRPQIPFFTRFAQRNPWCPPVESSAIFNSNDFVELKSAIAGWVAPNGDLKLSDGTGTDIGTAWGLNALSPAWRGQLGGNFPNRPADYDDDTAIKVAIIMTDGRITFQERPRDPNGQTHVQNQNLRQRIVERGGQNPNIGDNTAAGHYLTACDVLRANDVTVYTIGFQLTNTTDEAILASCASVPGNHFLVEDLDINAAFQAIRSSISNLRVSG